MDFLLPLAAKSFIVAGAALLVLRLAHKRSAAERSWVAHLGLAAVLMLPFASFALPGLHVDAPALVSAPTPDRAVAPVELPAAAAATEAAPTAATFPEPAGASAVAAIDWAFWLYAAPAGLLVLLTLIALARLFTLRARADVLMEPHWLTALARAQHRMGFKHGTALLTSDELPSPISWGVMRPVILLNREAANSHAEAEAIIAHELAHVASLDWAKLLLSRLTTALFWFNPFVWLLAREAHQLREEAADDAVLGADIVDTDYAQLLVGVARHECRGLLIGAHGVAPGKNSLTRRVRRVLDSGSVRGPVGRAFATGVFTGAVVLAAPLAALTLSAEPAEPAAVAHAPRLASVGRAAARPSPALAAPVAAVPAPAIAAAASTAAVHPHPVPQPGISEPLPRNFDETIDRQVDAALERGFGDVPPTFRGTHVANIRERFDAINVTGGGNVLVRYGRTPQVRILRGNGAGAFVNSSNGALSVSCRAGCRDLLVEVTTPRVDALSINGGGSIEVAGAFPLVSDLALAIHGGGRIDARQLPGRTVAAATHGGGTILTSARGQLAASTIGGGNIRYWGDANVASATQGGGLIEPGGT